MLRSLLLKRLKSITVREALNMAMEEEMKLDPDVFLLGIPQSSPIILSLSL
jgi:hypothetical protein